MADTDLELYRKRVRALVDGEVADLEKMRALFAASGNPTADAMAHVCKWSRERVELLGVRIKFLDYQPKEASGG